jgi:dolichol-phosphate mannosyltransferase
LSREQSLGHKSETPIVSFLIPAYKETEYIDATLEGIVQGSRAVGLACEIVVVLDTVPGDETVTHVRKISEMYHEIRVIERQGRRGVGDAIATAIKRARGRIVIPVMGDQSEDPCDVLRLATTAQDYDVVFTDRFKHGRPPGYPILKYVANRCCNLAAKLLFRIPYSDTTNAFKAYRRELLSRMDPLSRGFEIFLEMPVRVLMLGPLRTNEIEVRHTVRKKETAKLSLLRDGWRYALVLVSLLRRHYTCN